MDYGGLLSFNGIGLAGAGLYIAAYAMLQLRWLGGTGYGYTMMNLGAATLVLVSLTHDFNMSSVVIQMTWIAISVFGMTRTFYLHHATRLNPEEAALIAAKLPLISRSGARKFLDAGAWSDAAAGTCLAIEGEILGALVYLARGTAEVTHGGQDVGECGPGVFLGELTCFEGTPATATVTLGEDARYFRISTEALNRVCDRDPDLKFLLHFAFGRDTRAKLEAANLRMSLAGAPA